MRIGIRRARASVRRGERRAAAGRLARSCGGAAAGAASAAAAVCLWLWARDLGMTNGFPFEGLAARWQPWFAAACVAAAVAALCRRAVRRGDRRRREEDV